jgi:hypothetical protein
MTPPIASCTAFNGTKRIASGSIRETALKAKEVLDRDKNAQVLIFDDLTSELIEIDFRGTPAEVAKRLERIAGDPGTRESPPGAETRGPGRPKLGVVAREVTLLPRHWEWLASQPGGASVALRKLVEHGMKANRSKDQLRRAQEAAYRFLSAMAGNEPWFEEAIRALFGGQQKRFLATIEPWPADIRDHAKKLAAAVFASEK